MSVPLQDLRKAKAKTVTKDEEIWSAYKHTFLRDAQTRTVLAHLCQLAGFFGFSGDIEQQVRQNFVKQILCNCGIWDESKSLQIIEKLSELI